MTYNPDNYQLPAMSRPGWVCPKCGRVYGPDVQECWHCNEQAKHDWNQIGSGSPPPKGPWLGDVG